MWVKSRRISPWLKCLSGLGRVMVTVETVQSENMTVHGRQPAADAKPDEFRRARDQNCVIQSSHPQGAGSALPRRNPITRDIEGAAIPGCAAIARSAFKPYQGGEVRRPASGLRSF
jgi:hypothetical protein